MKYSFLLALFAAFCGSLFALKAHAARTENDELKQFIASELFPRVDTGTNLQWLRTPQSLQQTNAPLFAATIALEELTIAALLEERKDLMGALVMLGATERPRWTDAQGNTLLFWAVDQQEHDLADRLLQNGAYPTFVSPTERQTLVHVAISNRDGAMVKKLIKAAGGVGQFNVPALIGYAENHVGSQGIARSLRRWAESSASPR